MSNDPFDPFAQNERTIIRPNPGGRMAPPQGPRPQAQAAAPVAAAPVVAIETPGANPLVAAAGPLLDLLGRLRSALTMASFADLKASVARALDMFEAEATRRGADHAQLRLAKYTLCATADDIVQNLPGEDRHVWTQDPMLGRYFGERIGGTKFFENLAELLRNPGANFNLLELKYICLSLGFEGMHRTSPQGVGALQAVRRDVHQALRGVAAGGGWTLSPRWQGVDLGRRSLGMQIPFWAVAMLVLGLLAGLFFALRALLAADTATLGDEVRALHPTTDIVIARDAIVAPPPPAAPVIGQDTGQLDRIREALAPEIAAGQISAEYLDANYIIIRLPNELLFASGKADVTRAFTTGLAPRIGEVFQREAGLLAQKGMTHGRVVALGHSDAAPLAATSRWASNFELSKARATSVIDAILPHAPPNLRTVIEGRGPDDPVCTPATDRACFPKNRRVELLVERTS